MTKGHGLGGQDVVSVVARIWESLQASWLVSGGVNSGKSEVVQRLVDVSRRDFTEYRIGGICVLAEFGVRKNSVRLSGGIEPPDKLVADLRQVMACVTEGRDSRVPV